MITLATLTTKLETIVAVKPPGYSDWQWFFRDRSAIDAFLQARDDGDVRAVQVRRGSLSASLQALADQCDRVVRQKRIRSGVRNTAALGAMVAELDRMGEQAEALGVGEAARVLRNAAAREATCQGWALVAARVE